jgi:peptide/nickel transport system permease protein
MDGVIPASIQPQSISPLEQFTNETNALLRKDLRGKSLPQNRSRRALHAGKRLFQTLNAVKETARLFILNPSGLMGGGLFLFLLILSILGPMLYPVDPFAVSGPPFMPPSKAWPFGTDYIGRDILAGIIHGSRVTLAAGAAASCISIAAGVTVGGIAGYFGNAADAILMKLTELFQVMPALLFAMVLILLFGASLPIIAAAIGAVSWTGTARLTRAEFLRLRGADFVTAAVTAGARPRHVIFNIILPNASPSIIVAGTFSIGLSILFESSLSFLGLGDANRISWGLMVGQNREYILEAWWTVTLPGAAIFLLVLSVCLIGDALNDALNPLSRRR